MYCRSCGNEFVSEAANVCTKCGVQKGVGETYCQNCGSAVASGASVCLNCGVAVTGGAAGGEAKSKIAAGLLGIFLGQFGIHNFYLGYKNKALIQVIVTGVCHLIGIFTCTVGYIVTIWPILGMAIWGLVEGIMILTGSINKDAGGNLLKD